MNWMVSKMFAEWTDEKDHKNIWTHHTKPSVAVMNMENINAIRPLLDGFYSVKTISPPRIINCDIVAVCGDFAEAMNLANSEREKIWGDGDDKI